MNDALPTLPGAYRWWYVDAISADGRDALVAIFFSGSVFSPYYAARLRDGRAPRPSEHAAVHVAVYRDGRPWYWHLAERDAGASLRCEGGVLSLGRSSWRVDAHGRHTLRLDDGARRGVRGEVSFDPLEPPLTRDPVVLAPDLADHTWHARVPRARVRARFERPGFTLDADGYHDTNAGSEPMERALRSWDWARMHTPDGTSVLYDVVARDGQRFTHRLGAVSAAARASETSQRTGWGIAVPGSLCVPDPTPVHRIVESTPFYARYFLRDAAGRIGMGESLDLARFDSPVVRWMLRWRTSRLRPATGVAA